jgi:hypothetical protein
MTEEVLPESPLREGSVHFRTEEDMSGCMAMGLLVMGILAALGALLSLFSGEVEGFSDISGEVLILLSSTVLAGQASYSLIRGQTVEGLLVDGDGIVDRTKRFPAGRIYWHEIKSVDLFDRTFLPFPIFRRFIGVYVTDGYLLNQPTFKRVSIWLIRTLTRSPDIQIDTKNLSGSRDEILKALEDGIRNNELRSISEAKALESGGES